LRPADFDQRDDRGASRFMNGNQHEPALAYFFDPLLADDDLEVDELPPFSLDELGADFFIRVLFWCLCHCLFSSWTLLVGVAT
jgi:hypothetical protein